MAPLSEHPLIKLPIMPLREVVMFPKGIIPLFIGRKLTIKAINRSIAHHDSLIFMVAQRDSSADFPATRKELFHVGTVSRILQLLQMPDGGLKALFEGLYRTSLVPEGNNPKRYESLKLTSLASLYPFEEINLMTRNPEALAHAVIEAWSEYAHKKSIPKNLFRKLLNRQRLLQHPLQGYWLML